MICTLNEPGIDSLIERFAPALFHEKATVVLLAPLIPAQARSRTVIAWRTHVNDTQPHLYLPTRASRVPLPYELSRVYLVPR